ncbi:MAG: hypothetical protein LGR52_10375, partial [Candidatus Thiosymbion ectosymbiont of Robbea hypermnestra]|nr:hypothetical protein [Candidatus Thiosymbion ectosymbiont of Robbea hypermnestra]
PGMTVRWRRQRQEPSETTEEFFVAWCLCVRIENVPLNKGTKLEEWLVGVGLRTQPAGRSVVWERLFLS